MSQYPGQQAAFMQQAQMLLQQQMQQMQQMQQQGYVQPQQMQQQGYAQPQQLPQGYVMQQQYAQQPIGGYVQQSQPPYPYQQQPVGYVQQSQAYPYAPSQPGFVQPPPPYPMQQQMSSGFIAQPQLQPQPFLQHQNSVFINGGSVPQQQLQQQPQQQQILPQSFVQQTVSQPPVQQASFVPAPTGSAPFASAVQHVMMVQQQTPVTRSVAILDQRYVNQTQESLELVATKEKISDDDYLVKDMQNKMWFKLDAKSFSMKKERQLQDASGQVIATISKKIVERGASDIRVCRIRGEFVASKPAIDILLNDGDEQPDLQMTSHKPGKEFTIIETQTKRVICECRRQPWYDAGSKTASGQEHRHSVSGSDKYFLRIHPGVDAALMTLVCLMLDLIYKDEEKPLV